MPDRRPGWRDAACTLCAGSSTRSSCASSAPTATWHMDGRASEQNKTGGVAAAVSQADLSSFREGLPRRARHCQAGTLGTPTLDTAAVPWQATGGLESPNSTWPKRPETFAKRSRSMRPGRPTAPARPSRLKGWWDSRVGRRRATRPSKQASSARGPTWREVRSADRLPRKAVRSARHCRRRRASTCTAATTACTAAGAGRKGSAPSSEAPPDAAAPSRSSTSSSGRVAGAAKAATASASCCTACASQAAMPAGGVPRRGRQPRRVRPMGAGERARVQPAVAVWPKPSAQGAQAVGAAVQSSPGTTTSAKGSFDNQKSRRI